MKRTVSYFLLSIIAIGSVYSQDFDPKHAIGMTYVNEAEGFTYEGGWLITESPEIGVEQYSKGPVNMLWLLETLKRDGNKATRKVVDVLVLPKLNKKEFPSIGCRIQSNQDGPPDTTLVGIIQSDINESEWILSKSAWKIDLKIMRFKPLKPNSIECPNESFGL
ncbi:MAG: hypothetical protein ACKVQC_03330 [Elusimicrobiota bacterium]